MVPFAVVADDLTGAGDSGVQFALAGLPTRLVLGDRPVAGGPRVAVCSTDSRAVPASVAYERVRAAVAAMRVLGTTEVYKKIDSTLRGNLGAEIDAVLDEIPGACAVVCPAFPAAGRTVMDGYLLVGGQPVSATAIARDPATPVTESFIPAVIAQQSGRRFGQVRLDLLSGSPALAADAMNRLLADGAEVLVVDAVSEADLSCVVTASRQLSRRAVLVGSAGLAAPLAGHWAALAGTAPRDTQVLEPGTPGPDRMVPAGGKVLAVVGSVHPATRAQLDLLVERGMEAIVLDLEAALADDETWARWRDQAARRLGEALRRSDRDVVLTTPGTPEDIAEARRLARRYGNDPAKVPRLLAGRLAEVARAAAAGAYAGTWVTGLVVTGGDTAAMVLTGLGADGIDLVGEVEPGVPAGRLAGGEMDGLPVVTKAGGFGGRDALWRAVSYLRGTSALPR
ncbi:four-carbon acid sugar kinase family protein [Symbiobacterium terraclitae]|uniref:four-carbon acid sugar kinase family protein n=1 Tax=Symbiobacterium terraclitae TaxID=557451 RepID=UPI0035B51047